MHFKCHSINNSFALNHFLVVTFYTYSEKWRRISKAKWQFELSWKWGNNCTSSPPQQAVISSAMMILIYVNDSWYFMRVKRGIASFFDELPRTISLHQKNTFLLSIKKTIGNFRSRFQKKKNMPATRKRSSNINQINYSRKSSVRRNFSFNSLKITHRRRNNLPFSDHFFHCCAPFE